MARWMTSLSALLLLLARLAPAQEKFTNCPLLGPQYPAPTDIASDVSFQKAIETLESELDRKLNTTPFNTTSFSLSVFSASDTDLLWQYHHSTALLASSSLGARTVDADSVYRIGSISKLLTVYLYLMLEGDTKWNDPVIQYLPELERLAGNESHVVPNWTEITLGDLAGQMAGLGRDCEDRSCRNRTMFGIFG